ncbi:hypothetical protein MOMA_08266 [Moraxella macacae 0408225]|uniref:DUF218 domain-containing protein n=1 Tax=Moraxella macacae 0408225 TaxID=1230338 RepID=L2F6Y6_9GAMM|nr:YdcF family protein [Moraxella macacae]ELA08541.1 hypothetical protein MOMA_08266 [Moraxella macacae 0408225]
MAQSAKLIKVIHVLNALVETLGALFTVLVVIGVSLVLSLFTPLYSRSVLYLLNQISLPANAKPIQPATAIVVLGGGLTNDHQNNNIINQYTEQRLKTAVQLYQQQPLPIVVSGKEAPWMMAWLQTQNIWWVIPEKNSFNTCENAKFTAETVNVNSVILVTDAYHMNRSRRQFALYGISTTPYIAELGEPANWHRIGQNLKHSRRASYELLAFIRDLFYPQVDCKPVKHSS